MKEIYVSVDVETDGPAPLVNSMLSLGAAAFLEGELLDCFSVNLRPLQDARQDADTMKWWATQPQAWKDCTSNQKEPCIAMHAFSTWLQELPGKPVMVAYPAGFDFTFVYVYLIKFTGKSPFGFSALDMKSYAMALMGTDFRQTSKRTMPKRWFTGQRHTHVALDDAVEQGHLFMSMLREA